MAVVATEAFHQRDQVQYDELAAVSLGFDLGEVQNPVDVVR